MLDDFFIRALVAGIGLAVIAGPLGCFVIWRRMAYFGDTMAHSALLGVALSMLFAIDVLWGVFAVCLLVALLLLVLQARGSAGARLFSSDALLGILSHSALALGLVVVSLMSWLRVDILGFLIGDVLAVSRYDMMVIYAGGVLVLACLGWFWHSLLVATISEDIAEAEGLKPKQAELVLMVLLAVTIAIAIKIVGVLLITALLVIPAAAARRFSSTPEAMAILAVVIGVIAVVGGLFGSLHFDTPSGPSIVVAGLVVFCLSLMPVFSKAPISVPAPENEEK